MYVALEDCLTVPMMLTVSPVLRFSTGCCRWTYTRVCPDSPPTTMRLGSTICRTLAFEHWTVRPFIEETSVLDERLFRSVMVPPDAVPCDSPPGPVAAP